MQASIRRPRSTSACARLCPARRNTLSRIMSEGAARGIVVGHGAMAAGLVDAVKRIAGVTEDVLVAVSNEGKGPDALKPELTRIASQGRVVVFTDMHAGSCAVAARVACRAEGERAVVCGVNLPMLL